jgi:phosphoserine phosphatase RsbU/P
MATVPRASIAADFLADRQAQLEQVQDLLKVQKAAQKISSILDLDQLIEQIVNDVACSFGCLEATVYLHDEQLAELAMAGVKGCTVHGKGHRLKIGKESMVGYVAATGQMHYAPDVRLDPYYKACEPSTLSEVAIPLMVGSRLIGVFTASHHELDAFPQQQLRILQALCAHIAVAVENARLFERERRQKELMDREAQEARAIQQLLLPRSSPYVPGFAVSGFSIPAGALGGDWYDFIALDENRWGLVLADVSGKGMAAALLMSATRGMVRSLAQACRTPSEVLGEVNRLMVEDFPPGKFVTLIYGVLNPAERTVRFASAGHLPPLLVSGSEARFLETESGMPLGLGYGSFTEVEVHLPAKFRLVFYSDGITEATNSAQEEYARERLKQHVMRPEATAESILADVRSFASGAGLQDDATVIMLRA